MKYIKYVLLGLILTIQNGYCAFDVSKSRHTIHVSDALIQHIPEGGNLMRYIESEFQNAHPLINDRIFTRHYVALPMKTSTYSSKEHQNSLSSKQINDLLHKGELIIKVKILKIEKSLIDR
ncbi:MAG: hypothetical protein Q8L85_04615 [Alphaproteobacteria bacterium]|nr:hypothetical protein [Alphaproteobacteria bacterium]